MIIHILDEKISLDGGKDLEHTFIQPLELVYKHYKYELTYYDFFKAKNDTIDVSKIDFEKETIELSDLIVDKIPEYDSIDKVFTKIDEFEFEIGNFYRISYKDLQDRFTHRVIYVKQFVPKIVVIADCLKRNGEERHFRFEGILKIEVLDSNYFLK